MFNKILVPLDGSKLAEKALPYAVKIASEFGSKITLLNSGTTEGNLDRDQYQDYLQKTAADTRQKISKTAGPGITADVSSVIVGKKGLINDAAAEILDYAEKENIDMIVMVTHGHTGFTRWVLGNTANKIARAFKCPVLMVRAKTDVPDTIRLKKILVPLDGSKEGEAVFPYVEQFAARLSSSILLLNVVELLYHVYAYEAAVGYGGAGIVRVPYNPEEMKPFRETAEKYIRGVSGKLAQNKIENSTVIRVGAVGEEIIEAEEEIGPDLVLMSTHGQSGFGRFDHGSIADKVLHGGNTPLLLVKPQKTESGKTS